MIRQAELSAVEALCESQVEKIGYCKSANKYVYIDNIYGGFDTCSLPMHRESGVGTRFRTWCRARCIIHALLTSLGLPLVLALLDASHKAIKGLGISDDNRYAIPLGEKFTYTNTFFHQSPRLDVMVFDESFKDKYNFIICSDVLEHVIGDWRNAIANFYEYLQPGGVLVLSVPWKTSAEKTIEHYPGCTGYDVIEENGTHLVRLEYGDKTVVADNPVFHGGPGNTLEMRIFSFNELITDSLKIGFRSHTYFDLDAPIFGVDPNHKAEGVLVFEK